jgi:uncharacterized protein (TIGR00369 family)
VPDAAAVPIAVPDPASFAPLPARRAQRWARFGQWDTVYFAAYVGLQVEEIRVGYARVRLPYRPELNQPEGVVHGGAIATLVDTVVVPAIGSGYDEMPFLATLTMHVNYLGAVREDDAVAEGWVSRRGRSVVFCEVVVRTASSGDVAATASLVYKVSPPR